MSAFDEFCYCICIIPSVKFVEIGIMNLFLLRANKGLIENFSSNNSQTLKENISHLDTGKYHLKIRLH